MITTDFKHRMKSILSLDSNPGHIAAGFAVGVFISISPLFGMHTLLAIVSAFVFRLNKLTTITGSLVNTPLTVLPILMASYHLGEFLLGHEPRNVSFKVLDWHHLQDYATALFIGTSIIGLTAALLSYFVVYRLVIRFQQNDPGLAELSRESVMTGESLDQYKQEKKT